MAASGVPVDMMRKKVKLSFHIDTSGMKQGETRHMHHGAASILATSGIKHVDILNPSSCKITTHSTSGAMGVTIFHKSHGGDDETNGVQLLATDDFVSHASSGSYTTRAPLVSAPTKYHSVALPGVVSETTLSLTPTTDQSATNRMMTHKKLDSTWDGFGPKNVTAGAYKATLDGESHMLIRAEDHREGTPSAVHKLLEINGNNPKLWGGAYTNAKATKGLMVHGAPARKMSCAHYDEAVETLTKSLSTYSPFQHGVGVTVTKLDNSNATGDTFVTMEIERTPMDLSSGFKPAETKAQFTEDHLSAVNGSGGRAIPAAAVKETAAGFEKHIGKGVSAAEIRSRVSIVPVDELE